jgi:hypothetical protein
LDELRVDAVLRALPGHFRGEVLLAGHDLRRREVHGLFEQHADDVPVIPIDGDSLAAARVATGDILIFVDEGAVPLPDSVPALLRTLQRAPDIGIVGGRVIGGDGRLCEAGGLYRNGTLELIGAGSAYPDSAEHGFVRAVDWCTRSLLATWRTEFEEHGGFDLTFVSSHFQDADYCMRVRRNGRHVLYQPLGLVVRISDGHPVVNGLGEAALFAERWSDARVP